MDIVLTTLNARYTHASFGLRYLKANLGSLEGRSIILEFEVRQSPLEIAERILAEHPCVVGVGVYIWNIEQSAKVVRLLKEIRPEITVVLGGPEVSYASAAEDIVQTADYVIQGEADLTFATLCNQLLKETRPLEKVIRSPLPQPHSLALPYRLYTDHDLQCRTIYVEASRGCPFTCEFCLSSLDIPVRQFPLDQFLAELDLLITRGARSFKFVDRTFNLNIECSTKILTFFYNHQLRLQQQDQGLFLHFEMIPDRLPEKLRSLLAQFPPGSIQLEIGVQSLNEETNARIRRRQNTAKLLENLEFLRTQTGCHLHVDLIVGLPGDTVESFISSLDTLIQLRPHEIQIGILKLLKGTSLYRHQDEFQMRFASHSPYEVLTTRDIPFDELQRLRRLSRYFDLLYNSGNFNETLPLLWWKATSPGRTLLTLADWLWSTLRRQHEIALPALTQALVRYLIEESDCDQQRVQEHLTRDFLRSGRKDIGPRDMQRYFADPSTTKKATPSGLITTLPVRQRRHHRPAA